nr:hypothetical protein [uncultured Flavobacterium sp.]
MKKKILSFIFPSIPQVIGVVVFFIILKGHIGFEDIISERLPIYQMALSISSVIFLGISYSQSSSIVSFKTFIKIVSFTFFISLGTVFFNNSLSVPLIITILCSQVFINNKLLKVCKRFYYVIYLVIISFLSPQLLWINDFFLVGILIMQIIIYNNLSKEEISTDGRTLFNRDILISLCMQAPLLITSLFDPLLIDVIGNDIYQRYVMVLKITNGIALFAFAKIQLDVLYGEFNEVVLKKWIIYSNVFFILILGLSFIHNQIALGMQILFYSILININSLVIRANLKNRKNNLAIIIKPLVSIIIYLLFFILPFKGFRLEYYFIPVISLSYLVLIIPDFNFENYKVMIYNLVKRKV